MLTSLEVPCFAVSPNRDNGAQSPTSSPKSPEKRKSSRLPPTRCQKPSDTVDHHLWSQQCWVALTHALVRYPASHSDLYRAQEKEFFLNLYAKRSREGTAMKWLKFHTSYVFAYAWGQTELPTPPGPFEEGEKPGRFTAGHFGHAMTNILVRGRAGSMPYRRCAYDILMSKLGFPQAPPSFVESSMDDHRKALTRTQSLLDEADEETLLKVESKIDEICESVFKGVVFHHRDAIPSIRASQENGLLNAGGFGELVSGFDQTHSFLAEEDTLFAMLETHLGKVRELRFIDMRPRVQLFQEYVDSLWTKRLSYGLHATPVPICEPLKVRIITKGQAAEYYRCIELQKLMHGALRRHPVFQCIGHPIEDDDWVYTFRSREDLKENEFFVSGDYKAATDNLRSDLSEFAWKCICSKVQASWDSKLKLSWTKYQDLGLKALTGHILHYGSDEYPQSWGQLMGSPMSFPILCIVNAAATLVALDEKFSEDNRIRVNGDDIAFIANPESYARWKSVTHLCGLDFSIGKNYTSREFIIMNSELRRSPVRLEFGWRPHREDRYEWRGDECFLSAPLEEECALPWKFEGFVNQCLLYNTIKKGQDAGKQKDTYWTDLSSISSELFRGIPDRHTRKLYGIFFKTYDSQIREAPKNCNKWFPKALGGMGLALPDKGDVELRTDSDRLLKQQRVAAYLSCDPKARLQRVTMKRPVFGVIGQTFKDIRSMCDEQVPRVIHKKLRNRECTPIMGGTTLLGYLLGVSCLVGGKLDQDGQWLQEPLGGFQPEGLNGAHSARAADLRRQYQKWTHKAISCSLSPMRIDHILGYSEHLEMSSRIETMHDDVAHRSMD